MKRLFLMALAAALMACPVMAQPVITGPLQAQNALGEIASNGSGAKSQARVNIGFPTGSIGTLLPGTNLSSDGTYLNATGSGGGLSPISNDLLLGNISGSSAVPIGITLSALMSASMSGCSTPGAIPYNIGGTWGCLAPGTNGQSLQMNGSSAIEWAASNASAGTSGQVQASNGSGGFNALTATQLTADINTFTSSLSGAVPAPGADPSTYVLTVSGWAAPSGGSAAPGGSSGQLQWNNGGAFAGFTATGDATITPSTGAVVVGSIGGKAVTLGGALTTSGAYSLTLTLSGASSVTLPTSGTLLATTGNGGSLTGLAYSQLPALSANQILGALTATTPSGLSIPSCSGGTNALTYASGIGFGCNTISGSGSPGGSSGQVQYNNSGSFGGLTNTQLTADINTFTSSASGAVPAYGANPTTDVLTPAGWAAPSGGVSGPGSSTSGDVATFNGTGGNALQDAGGPYTRAQQNIQTFTASGTWIKPAFCSASGVTCYTDILLIGGGGGGGSGGQASAGTAVSPGGSGGGGAWMPFWKYPTASLASTVTVTVPTSASGGASVSTGAGNGGTAGGNTSFGSLVAYGGGAGSGGQVSASSFGGASGGISAAGNSATSTANGSGNAAGGSVAGGGGTASGLPACNEPGTGGSVTAGSGAYATQCIGGSASGGVLTTSSQTAGGAGGSVPGAAGGSSGTTGAAGGAPAGDGGLFPHTSGAGGGGGNYSGAGGAGGTCPGSGAYGAAGAGGGSGTTGGGAGGAGCPGYAVAVTYGITNGS